MNKKGQVTIFIIIAMIIVVVGASYFIFKDSLKKSEVPSNFAPIEQSFLDCIESNVMTGISILETRGGYIELPKFVPGSNYMPFSSELDFFGTEIPYWHYISGNNIPKEQIPTLEHMEEELASFVESKVDNCNLQEYKDQGYIINYGVPSVEVTVNDDVVISNVKMDLYIERDLESSIIKNHDVEVNSKLGSLYKDAKEVYSIEEETFFLENYSIDVLRNYLPVDGIEISCSPLTWNAYDLYADFNEALEVNILALKNSGAESDYFALNLPVDSDLRFITFKNWPNTFEVLPGDSETLVAKPVGNQAGLGILGFCYVPYHFVYNVRYPVLIQVIEGDEIFQFPIAVLIEGNVPRVARKGESVSSTIPNLCEFNNTLTKISLYNSDLEIIDGEVSFECFSSTCELGNTKNGIVEGSLPQCVNGKLVVEAEGYKIYSEDYTSVDSGEVIVILDKEYEKNVQLYIDEKKYFGNAIVSFISESSSESIVYPTQNKVTLGEGEYEIQINLIENATLTLPESTREECYDVPRSGVGGIFGMEKKECNTINVPEQIISNVLIGGGKDNYYFLESELENSRNILLGVNKLSTPKSLEELQQNYILFETQGVEVAFE